MASILLNRHRLRAPELRIPGKTPIGPVRYNGCLGKMYALVFPGAAEHVNLITGERVTPASADTVSVDGSRCWHVASKYGPRAIPIPHFSLAGAQQYTLFIRFRHFSIEGTQGTSAALSIVGNNYRDITIAGPNSSVGKMYARADLNADFTENSSLRDDALQYWGTGVLALIHQGSGQFSVRYIRSDKTVLWSEDSFSASGSQIAGYLYVGHSYKSAGPVTASAGTDADVSLAGLAASVLTDEQLTNIAANPFHIVSPPGPEYLTFSTGAAPPASWPKFNPLYGSLGGPLGGPI